MSTLRHHTSGVLDTLRGGVALEQPATADRLDAGRGDDGSPDVLVGKRFHLDVDGLLPVASFLGGECFFDCLRGGAELGDARGGGCPACCCRGRHYEWGNIQPEGRMMGTRRVGRTSAKGHAKVSDTLVRRGQRPICVEVVWFRVVDWIIHGLSSEAFQVAPSRIVCA